MFILLILSNTSCKKTSTPEDILWFGKPAEIWEEALPVGNGRIGAMVFGKTDTERIQLNDDSLWPAEDGWYEPDGSKEDLEKIRDLLLEGQNTRADQMIVDKFSRKGIVKSHQTLGELFIEMNHTNITEYRRELNLTKALTNVSYKTNGHLFTQTVLASHPHEVIAIKLTSEAPGGMNGKVRLVRPPDNGYETASTKVDQENLLVMKGEVVQMGGVFDSQPKPVNEGVKFETCLKIDHADGTVVNGGDFLQLKGVKEAIFYLVSNSSYYHENIGEQNRKDLEALQDIRFSALQEKHVQDHQQLYSRVNLYLESENRDTIPVNERIARIKQGESDPGLTSLLFQYGRYLLIASSRPGTNPANLQGIWNEHIEAPWNADYHLNINLQMNYWLADVTNLAELNQPLFDYIDKLVENGKTTAQKNFGCRGTFIPHASDLWGATFMQAATAYWGSSFGAAGWMMQHYWQHFEFHKDTTFLKERVFPALHEVAQFYSDWIIEDPRDGSLISAPSTSPENRYIDATGQPVALCLGSAFDQQIIAEVFDNYIQTCRILNTDNELSGTIKKQRNQLRDGFVTGSDGRILEWDREYPEFEPGHRHMSHLYGFHPGTSVTKTSDPDLFDAVRKTLDYRLDHGGAGTGWSRAWLINCAARLFDGEMAEENIRFFFTNSVYDNLFCSHPPYQIDGNFGFTAGIAEMLLQSHEPGIIRILPALPPTWATGYVNGLKARGGYTVDVVWENGRATHVRIQSQFPGKVSVMVNNETIEKEFEKDDTSTINL